MIIKVTHKIDLDYIEKLVSENIYVGQSTVRALSELSSCRLARRILPEETLGRVVDLYNRLCSIRGIVKTEVDDTDKDMNDFMIELTRLYPENTYLLDTDPKEFFRLITKDLRDVKQ